MWQCGCGCGRLGSGPSPQRSGVGLQDAGCGCRVLADAHFGKLAVAIFMHRALGFRGNAASPWQMWQLSVSYPLLSSVGSGKIN